MKTIDNNKAEENEAKVRDEKVTRLNEESYKDKNIKSVKEIRDKFKDAKGKTKEKVIERVTYKNGVVKNRLVGVYKEGRLIYNVASKSKKTRKAG